MGTKWRKGRWGPCRERQRDKGSQPVNRHKVGGRLYGTKEVCDREEHRAPAEAVQSGESSRKRWHS